MEGKNPVSYNGSGIAPMKANYDYFNKNKIDKLNKSSILIWSGQQRHGQNFDF